VDRKSIRLGHPDFTDDRRDVVEKGLATGERASS